MHNRRLVLFVFLFLSAFMAQGQDRHTIQQYIDTYKDMAMSEMLRSGIPASITLAQGIHETTAGTSPLVMKSNNHFGIKCKSNWTGERVSHTDDAPNECFRKYADPNDSYRDHSDFLRNGSRYAFLFDFDPLDYKAWAHGLKKAGYATNPRYPQVIIKLIEEYGLQDYTLIALERKQSGDGELAVQKESRTTPVTTTVEVRDQEQEETTAHGPAVPVANYPSGEFRINGTRVIHVAKGTSFLGLAQQYNIPLKRIFEFNEMDEIEAAQSNQLIFLQRKRKTGEKEYHVVLPGETLVAISQTEGIRLESLLQYNNLSGGMEPAPGEQLYLRKKSAATPRLLSRNRK